MCVKKSQKSTTTTKTASSKAFRIHHVSPAETNAGSPMRHRPELASKDNPRINSF
jgi:hypothetical protein